MPINTPVHEGEILLGKYRVESILGMGGMGIVVCARHMTLDERVAIKLLLPTLVSHPPVVARFLQEAKAAARLKSEHIARVSDFGTLEDGTPFLVMEYLDGADLEGVLRACDRFEVEEAIDYVLQVSEALAEAHRMGIVHRDIKPENLFLTEGADGAALVKILDFGISKIESAEATLTQNAGELLGSPAYMAPEQFHDPGSASARSDIWALGVLLYEFLTGKLPFDGSTLHAILAAVSTKEPEPLSAHRGDLPEGLSEAILTCLRKDPNERPQDVLELADLLAPFVSEHVRMRVSKIAAISRKSRTSMVSIPGRITPAGVRSLSNVRVTAPVEEAPQSSVRESVALASEMDSSPVPSQWSRTPSPIPRPETSVVPPSWATRLRARAYWFATIASVTLAIGVLGARSVVAVDAAAARAPLATSYQASGHDELVLRRRLESDMNKPIFATGRPAAAASAAHGGAVATGLPTLPKAPAEEVARAQTVLAQPDVVTGH